MKSPLFALALLAGCGAAPAPAPSPAPPTQGPAAPAPVATAPEPARPEATQEARPEAKPACAPLELAPLPRVQAPLDPALQALEDEGQTLAPVYEKLAALLRGSAERPLRIAVYGDSNVIADWITGGLRRTLQGRLGDGGHGFVALGKPWPGYVHRDVKHGLAQAGWSTYAVSTKPVPDHRYGFAGIAVQSSGPGARTWVETAQASAPVGKTASRIGVHFLKGPSLGAFEVRIDGKRQAVVETESPEFAAGHAVFDVDDAPHRVLFESSTTRSVRLFGATLERPAGVVVDSLGVAASTTATILRQEHAIYQQALAQRGYDLVILLHGTFDVTPWGGNEEKHAAAMKEMIALHRAALPGVAILVLSPVDYRGPTDDSLASPGRAAREKRAAARASAAAFWDLRAAMGGDRAIYRFNEHHMADPDHIHLNERGGEFMGNRLALALWEGLAGHAKLHPRAGCGAP